MGNKCPGRQSSWLSCCSSSKKSHKREPSGDVLPGDLHASSGQTQDPGPSLQSVPSPRPDSLEIPPAPQQDGTSKFPAFSLHGVQKSSPSLTDDNQTPLGSASPEGVDVKKIEMLFQGYCDSSDKDVILADGVERFCNDLDVDPTEFIVLALAWKFKAETMCKFTRKEFVDGFLGLQCDSINILRAAFKRIESEAMENFKDLYRFTFQFALDPDIGQRSLPCEIASAMWNVVFSLKTPPLLQSWITFLEESNVRGISRDTWNMFLHLVESFNEDLSNYNDAEAWPSLFDDFVDYKREEMEKMKQSTLEDYTPVSNSAMHTTEEKLPESETKELCSSHNSPEEDPSLVTEKTLNQIETVDKKLIKAHIPGAISSSDDSLEKLHQYHKDLPLFSNDAEIGDHALKEEADDLKKEVMSSSGEVFEQLHSEP